MSQRRFDREARRRERTGARRTSLKRRHAGLMAGAVGAAVMLTPAAAHAAPFQVTSLDDAGSGSLRDAISQANTNGEDDTITFADNVRGTIYLSTGELPITSGITITGPGADDLTISGQTASDGKSNSRIFNVSGSGDARISGLTLSDGNGTANGEANEPPDQDRNGGAILSNASLQLSDSVVSGNDATAEDPFIPFFLPAANGGGIAVTGGQTTVSDSDVTDNDASGFFASGGGISNSGGTLAVHDSSVTHNEVDGFTATGGGIAADGATTVQGSHVDGNTADGSASAGGGIANGTVSGKYGEDILTPFGRDAGSNQLQITDSTVSNNDATYGGGVAADFSSAKFAGAGDGVTITRSTVDHNTASSAGGGVGVENQGQDNAFAVHESTISNNAVQQEVPVDDDTENPETTTEDSGTGGGLDFADVAGPALVSNSTVSGNSAAAGGGIHAGSNSEESLALRSAQKLSPALGRAAKVAEDDPGDGGDETPTPTGSLVVSNTTVASNDASESGGGAQLDSGGTDGADTQLPSTIVGDNTANGAANDLVTNASGFDLAYSLIETPGTATTTPDASRPSITGKDPALGGLTDNGGPTETMLPDASSPAIDAGDAEGLTGDQRAFARTVNRPPANVADGTDIGAVELPPLAVIPPKPVTPSSSPTQCGRRTISLVRADVKRGKVKLSGLVGSKLYGKKITIQTDPKGAKASGFTKTTSVTASSRTGEFTVSVPKLSAEDYVTARYRAVAGHVKSPALKLPQSLTSRSVKSAKGTITVKGHVKLSVLGKRHAVKVRRLVCGRYRTVGSARPDEKGNYTVTFKSTAIRGVSFYRAESHVLRKPGSKHYVTQYARAIAIRTTSQTG